MTRNAKLALAILLGIGLCLRIWIAFLPIDTLCTKAIPDDAFYYFQTARHIAAGHGSTFDGVERHNGYHPAWMGMILPVFAVVPDDLSQPGPMSAVRGVLVLGAMLDVFAAFLLFHIARRLTGSAMLGILASSVHSLNLWAILHAVDGLETSLLGVMISITLFVSLEPMKGIAISRRRAVGLGACLGMLMLARTDAVLLAGPLLAVLLFVSDDRRTALRRSFTAGIVASLFVIPWLLWSKWYVGTW